MKTTEVTAHHFLAKFGEQYIHSGSFSYYECDNGLGIIKDNIRNSIELVSPPNLKLDDISEEDEFALLTMVCGNFKKDVIHPVNDSIYDYENREQAASRNFTFTRLLLVLLLLALTLFALMLIQFLIG